MSATRPLYVVGTGGLAREIAQFLTQLKTPRRVSGFISKTADEIGGLLGGIAVAGDDTWLLGQPGEIDVVIAIGRPADRAAAVARLRKAGDLRFPVFIHPTAIVDTASVELGQGTVVTAGCVFTCDVVAGEFNVFNWQTTVGHDVHVGDCCVINPSSNVSGYAEIGDRVLIGAGAQVLERCRIGSDAQVGAGAVVTRDVAPGTTVVGVPARLLGR